MATSETREVQLWATNHPHSSSTTLMIKAPPFPICKATKSPDSNKIGEGALSHSQIIRTAQVNSRMGGWKRGKGRRKRCKAKRFSAYTRQALLCEKVPPFSYLSGGVAPRDSRRSHPTLRRVCERAKAACFRTGILSNNSRAGRGRELL